ncbi:B12-binding domain-containing radical SAM protein [Methanopyrus sp. SNP6]|uniref:B12-binding domain-containing radical SAM protein n=1 Tax=Methanopyrus sp. SNP6 TaxID=1937005 RepID=UPI0011E5DA70|nr:radical SAM protein [Methanopyrus sp. SNP6]
MIDVLLINPPDVTTKYQRFLGITAPPLGLAYIAAVLEEAGYTVKILDCPPLDMSFEDLRRAVRKLRPRIVSIMATTPIIHQAYQAAKIVKEELEDAIVCLGGYHPTFMDIECLKECPYVDVVVRREGEFTLLDLAKVFIDGVKTLSEVLGITYREEDDIVRAPDRPLIRDLDALPFPARHLLPMDKYTFFGAKTTATTMVSSRGCPVGCDFCASSAMHGHKLRMHSAERVVSEMAHVHENYGSNIIAFVDDTFTYDRRRVEEICRLIVESGLDVTWGCAARVDTIDRELLELMREAGCSVLFFGVESGSQEVLDNVGKGFTVEQTKKAFQLCREFGIVTVASAVIGLPGETHRSARQTIKFLKEIDPDYAVVSVATPYPGTKFYKEAVEKGLIEEESWDKYTLTDPVVRTTELSLEDVKKYQKRAMIGFYLRPRYLIRRLKEDGIDAVRVTGTMIAEVAFKKMKALLAKIPSPRFSHRKGSDE